jgi:transposase
MIRVEEWAEIRRLRFAVGRSIKAIARELGLARNTVRMAIRSSEPPRYDRSRRGSIVDALEGEIRTLLSDCPTMPATVIAERIGWTRGLTVLRERVRELRPTYQPPEPYQRTEYRPGELAQWDLWFPPVDIPVEYGPPRRFPVIVGVSGYSRWLVGRMIPSRAAYDLLWGHRECLEDLGRVPRLGVYDNEGAIGTHRGKQVVLTEEFQRFRGTLGMGVHVLRPRHAEGKGVVERANGYFETSFLPGRDFTGVGDFNTQFAEWLDERANRRFHRGIRARPCDRIEEDHQAMLPLPPLMPDPSWRHGVRLGRDHYVRFETCDYSVHPKAIGSRVEVHADLEWVVVRRATEEVARHRRSLALHRTITDPVHAEARAVLQRHARAPSPRVCELDVEVRDLEVYDTVAGAY